MSGWRGLCSFDGIVAPDGATLFGCELVFDDSDRWQAGQEIDASLRFWVPREDAKDLASGLPLRLFEGDREISSGTITDLRER